MLWSRKENGLSVSLGRAPRRLRYSSQNPGESLECRSEGVQSSELVLTALRLHTLGQVEDCSHWSSPAPIETNAKVLVQASGG